jgi:hypothetical protein
MSCVWIRWGAILGEEGFREGGSKGGFCWGFMRVVTHCNNRTKIHTSTLVSFVSTLSFSLALCVFDLIQETGDTPTVIAPISNQIASCPDPHHLRRRRKMMKNSQPRARCLAVLPSQQSTLVDWHDRQAGSQLASQPASHKHVYV